MQPDLLQEYSPYIVALGLLSGVLYMARNLLAKFWGIAKKPFMTELRVFYSDNFFGRYNEWLTDNRGSLFFVRTYRVGFDYEPVESGGESNTKMVPGYGTMLLKLKGYPPIIFRREKDDNKKGLYVQADILVFIAISIRKHHLSRFAQRVYEETEAKKDRHRLYIRGSNFWEDVGSAKRVLPPVCEASKEFLDDLKEFLEAQSLYQEKGLSYKRGYLLHGIPGSGKTSLVAYAARRFNLPVYSTMGMGDIGNLSDVHTRPAIILIEDIDLSIYASKRQHMEKSIPDEPKPKLRMERASGGMEEKADDYDALYGLSALRDFMNLLDGIQSIDGFVFVFTTNNRDALDDALLRPGRVDKQIRFTNLSAEEQIQFMERFYNTDVPREIVVRDQIEERRLADLQFICLKNMGNCRGAISEIGGLNFVKDYLEAK